MADDKIVISAVAKVVDQATKQLQAIQKTIAGVSDTARKTSNSLGGMGRTIGGAMAGMTGRLGAATSRIGAFTRSAGMMITPLKALIGLGGIAGASAAIGNFISKTQEIAGAATRLGVSTDMVQVFANVFGDSMERASGAMLALQRTIGKVQKGGKGIEDTTKLFAKMGITAKQIAKGDLGEILPIIMESFKKTTDPVKRTNMALALFNKSGQELIPWLAKGKEGFNAAVDEMVRMGIISADIAKGLKAGAAMKDLNQSVESLSNSLISQVLPAITGVVEGFTKWIDANKELLKQIALPAFIGAIAIAVGMLAASVWAALGPWGLLAAAVVAAGVAIYQNWDPIIEWLDKEMPGLTSTITQAGNDIAAWAKRASANISKGFEEGGLAGGVTAYMNEFKLALVGIGEWFADLFRKINWATVGQQGANLLWQAFVAVIKADIALGQFLIDQWKAVIDWIRAADWGQIGRDAGKALGEAIMATIRLAADFDKWTYEMAVKVGDAFRNADWTAILNKITEVFLKINMEMIRIGKELILGLIAGMKEALPGLSDITGAIADAGKAVSDWWNKPKTQLGDASGSGTTGSSWSRGANTKDVRPSVLRQQAANNNNAGGTTKTDIKITTEPGMKVDASQTHSGPGKAELEVGKQGTVAP